MPPISDRILDKEGDAQYVLDIPVMTSPFVPPLSLGPSGAPIPSRGLPPNEYITDSTIQQRNPDSPTLQRNIMGIIGGWRPFTEPVDSAPAQIVTPSVPVATAPSTTAPLPVSALLALESPYKAAPSGLYSLVSIEFNRVLSDTNFGHVNVWALGYHGSSVPELVASGTSSPVSFLLETTGETITLFVASVSINGKSNLVAASPFALLTLDGVTSAPPAPTVTQTLVGMPAGYQFIFAQEGGLLADVIANYNVYRNTSNTSVGATLVRQIPQNAANNGQFVFQDFLNDAVTYYYFVSAVNTSGLESSKTSAQSGAITSSTGSVPPSWNTNFGYDSPIPGTSLTIYWDGTHSSTQITIYRADGTTTGPLSGSQTITGLTASTLYYFYPYYDESSATLTFATGGTGTPAIAFTAPSFTAAQSAGLRGHVSLANSALQATTGSGGGGSSGGGSGYGCVMEGSEITPLSGIVTGHTEPWKDWIQLTTENGFSVPCVPTHPVISILRGKTWVKELLIGERIITKRGVSSVCELRPFVQEANKVVVHVPDGELYWANGILSSNRKQTDS